MPILLQVNPDYPIDTAFSQANTTVIAITNTGDEVAEIITLSRTAIQLSAVTVITGKAGCKAFHFTFYFF